MTEPLEVGGYVLAGGKSSRMGQDKALMVLDRRPLVEYAVAKVGAVCRHVRILASRPELERYGRLVPDEDEGCGPMGGLQAALRDCPYPWVLMVPVDVPFLPGAVLRQWVGSVLARGREGVRVAMFTVDGVPQPALAMVHREVREFVETAVQRGSYKLYPVLAEAAGVLAEQQGLGFESGLWSCAVEEFALCAGQAGRPELRAEEIGERRQWFANLNTPEEFAKAREQAEMLER